MKYLKITFYSFWIVVFIWFCFYLATPISSFPPFPADAVISEEPADTETPLRRAFFTNLTRQEIINHYQNYYPNSLRLNYPPEEAQSIIRDQTRSTFLEELAYPLRESIYINGFEPTLDKDVILIDGENFRQKIIVRHVPSDSSTRVLLGASGLLILYIMLIEYKKEFNIWRKSIFR